MRMRMRIQEGVYKIISGESHDYSAALKRNGSETRERGIRVL